MRKKTTNLISQHILTDMCVHFIPTKFKFVGLIHIPVRRSGPADFHSGLVVSHSEPEDLCFHS